ncbi:MAG: hypothetical protein HXS46_06195 [Theionarchaea archaeon]|nr:hypothetical protein [Theionarchaea archaeon]
MLKTGENYRYQFTVTEVEFDYSNYGIRKEMAYELTEKKSLRLYLHGYLHKSEYFDWL